MRALTLYLVVSLNEKIYYSNTCHKSHKSSGTSNQGLGLCIVVAERLKYFFGFSLTIVDCISILLKFALPLVSKHKRLFVICSANKNSTQNLLIAVVRPSKHNHHDETPKLPLHADKEPQADLLR